MSDLLSPKQWTHQILKIEEARNFLGSKNLDQHGKGLIIAVIDKGLLSDKGIVTSGELSGNRKERIVGKLTSSGISLSAKFKVKDISKVSNNQEILIGTPGSINCELVKIKSKNISTKEVTTYPFNFFKFHHKKGTSVYLKTGNTYELKTQLNDLVSPTKMELTIKKPYKQGNQYRIGAVIKIGNDKFINDDFYYHRSVIEKINDTATRTKIIAHPIWAEHTIDSLIPETSYVIQNDKIFALFNGFNANNFAVDNDTNTLAIPGAFHGLACASIVAGSYSFNNTEGKHAYGTNGILPGAKLMGIILSSVHSEAYAINLATLRWISGTSKFDHGSTQGGASAKHYKGTPFSIAPDIITCSMNLPVPHNKYPDIKLSKITRRGRNGRGTLCFFSAGNNNTLMDGNIYSNKRISNSKYLFACSASTLDETGNEIKAPYSNYGMGIEWCAPTSRFSDLPHNPPNNYHVFSLDEPKKGNYISYPEVEVVLTNTLQTTSRTELRASVNIGERILPVVDTLDFAADDWILIGSFRKHEWKQIESVNPTNNTITLKIGLDDKRQATGRTKLNREHQENELILEIEYIERFSTIDINRLKKSWIHIKGSNPEWVQLANDDSLIDEINGTLLLSTKLQNKHSNNTEIEIEYYNKNVNGVLFNLNYVEQISKSTTIQVTITNQAKFNEFFKEEKWILLNSPQELNSESVLIRSVNNNNIEISSPFHTHIPGEKIFGGPNDYQDDFGGTSAATPLCAGIAGLVLLAKPTLTWLEVRYILRTTAEKIDSNNPGLTTPHPNAGIGKWETQGVDFNSYYGYGRLNALEAVKAAFDFSHDDLDLMIRNYLFEHDSLGLIQDDGITKISNTDAGRKFHSPDIWISKNKIDAPIHADQHPNHINPSDETTISLFLHARIKNRGSTITSIGDSAIRFYIYRSGNSSPFQLPEFVEDETDISELSNDKDGLYFLNELKIGPIKPETFKTLSYHVTEENLKEFVEWKGNIRPPSITNINLRKRTFILAEITPYDGVLNGRTLGDNNNFARREISFAKLDLLDSNTGYKLENKVLQLSTIAGDTNTAYSVKVVDDIGFFKPDEISIEIKREKKSGGFETQKIEFEIINNVITEKKTVTPSGGVSWVNSKNFNFLPTNSPLFRCNEFELNFEAILDNNFKNFSIRVIQLGGGVSPKATINEHKFEATVIAPYENPNLNFSNLNSLLSSRKGTNVIPSLQAKSHFFINGNNFTQNASQIFGPISNTQFRTTSKVNIIGNQSIYSICSGQILIQPRSGNVSKVNVILRPFKQPIKGVSIKYIIYRNMNKNDFITSSNNIAAKTKTGFTNFIWNEFEKFYDNETTPTFTGEYIGYSQNSIAQNESDLIDQYFHKITKVVNESTGEEDEQYAFELPIVPRGTHLGNVSGNFGIDIILNNGAIHNNASTFKFDLKFARELEGIIDTAVESNSFKKKMMKESCLAFMDLAAYYGLHANGSGKLYYNDESSHLKTKEDIYDKLAGFLTKNNLYIYIQSNRQRSYNFYENYNISNTNANDLKIGVTEENLTETKFGTQGWPIHIFNDVQNTQTEDSQICLQLTTDNHIQSGLYIQNGQLVSDNEENFVRREFLLQGSTNQTPDIFTRPQKFISPAISSKTIATIVMLFYHGKQLEVEEFMPPGSTITPEVLLVKNIDDVFGLIEKSSFIKTNNENQFPSIIDNQLQLFSFSHSKNKSDLGVIRLKKVADKVQFGDDDTFIERVTYETLLQNIFRESSPLIKSTSASSENDIARIDDFSNNYYQPENPYYYKIKTFSNSTKTINGLILEIKNKIPSKKIIGISKTENSQIEQLINDNNLSNAKLYLKNTLLEESNFFKSSEGIKYKQYQLGLIAEENSGKLKFFQPTNSILLYTIDECVFFSYDYCEYVQQSEILIHDSSMTIPEL
ncbi:MAG: S8 family serine peptidase [Saprospiraceae bacterium]